MEPGSGWVLPSDSTKGSGQKLMYMSKNFTVWMPKHWTRLPREVVESPSLEVFRRYLDTILNNLLWGTLAFLGTR